jgi:hypothetical protein
VHRRSRRPGLSRAGGSRTSRGRPRTPHGSSRR